MKSQQDGVVNQARALGGREKGRASKSVNAVAVTIDASKIDELAAAPGVVSVRPVARYHTTQAPAASGSLAQAAQYLGADKVRAAGFDGTGVRVAVLDSGVDFTHRNLGGPGTEAVYDTCYAQNAAAPSGPCAGLFGPSAPKVKGGFDFVGERWTGEQAGGPEAPDPNPIDLEGHGTHVSDIIGGRSTDGTHLGIAPGVDLYGVKVCSAVSTSCSNIAILQGIDWALDPNNDGDIRDAVDLINLSLGSDYGQPEDDSTLAVNEAAKLGVTVVISAGNGGDQPFKVGSPSTAPRVISVAQTALPDDSSIPIQVTSPSGIPTINLTTLVSWSPAPTAAIDAALRRPGGPLGCTAANFAGFPAGSVALIDRGTCNVSLKAQLAQSAGAVAVVLRNNVAGAPPDFSFGGGDPVTIPVLVVGRTPGTTLVAAVNAGPVSVRIDPNAAQSLRGTIAGTSSRGPVQSFSTIKPDIGAPGAWLSAEAGTGAGETNFGGTSGAAPTVSGVAALVLDRFPKLGPVQVKARLLNAADTGNLSLTELGERYPTPITRIGAGEVRAEAAVFATYVFEADDKAGGNLSIGLPHLASKQTFEKKVTIRNTDTVGHTYTLAPSFRDPADAALGALSIQTPNRVVVGPRSTKQVVIKFTVDPARLTPWPLTGLAGPTGEDAIVLNGPELDGWITATCESGEQTHLGWQVLPHRSADVAADGGAVRTSGGKGELTLRNASKVLDGNVDVFSLTGTSPKRNDIPGPGSNESHVDLRAVGVRDLTADDGTPLIEFAFHGAGRKSTPGLPAEYDIDLDVNRDGSARVQHLQRPADDRSDGHGRRQLQHRRDDRHLPVDGGRLRLGEPLVLPAARRPRPGTRGHLRLHGHRLPELLRVLARGRHQGHVLHGGHAEVLGGGRADGRGARRAAGQVHRRRRQRGGVVGDGSAAPLQRRGEEGSRHHQGQELSQASRGTVGVDRPPARAHVREIHVAWLVATRRRSSS